MEKVDTINSLLAVFAQFWKTRRTYMLLANTRNAGIILVAVVVVISAGGYIPTLLIDWERVDAQWTEVRLSELHEQGFNVADAERVIAGELLEMRGMTESLPLARLIERGLIAALAALAAFGLVYAVEGKRSGRITDYITSSLLSQAAYMITGVLLVILVSGLDIPPSIRLNLSIIIPVDTVNPTRVHVFFFRFLDNIDFPSIVSLLFWGAGLSALNGRKDAWGIRLCFSVYLIGIMLISLPVLFAPAS